LISAGRVMGTLAVGAQWLKKMATRRTKTAHKLFGSFIASPFNKIESVFNMIRT